MVPVVAPVIEEVFEEFDADDALLEDEESEEKLAKERAKVRRRELVFDEDLGEVVAKRRRKAGRRRAEWEEFEGLDVDDLEDFDEIDDFDALDEDEE